ncbi:MAG: SEL1-like repeat protein, partial [Vicinamibacterales bacterium]|nr:SEL1-like repeat protein [Vicinamibacterales bacterium]
MTGCHINRLIFVLVGFGLVVLSTLSCVPQDPQPRELTRQQINDLRSRAERGEVEAQYELGFMHWYGLGVAHDEAVAMDWYLRAA